MLCLQHAIIVPVSSKCLNFLLEALAAFSSASPQNEFPVYNLTNEEEIVTQQATNLWFDYIIRFVKNVRFHFRDNYMTIIRTVIQVYMANQLITHLNLGVPYKFHLLLNLSIFHKKGFAKIAFPFIA